MTWIKDINGKWHRPNNDIKLLDFKQNLKPTNETVRPQVSTIYIPTHNIKDVYEWYRIFKDSYAFSNNFDKNGHAIHAYFDKNRGESIKGWFPNLVEVKASSSDEVVYYTSGSLYNRASKDYITSFTVNDLIIDNVPVYDGEYVLLKNQNYNTLSFYTVDPLLSTGYKYYAQISSGDEQYFGIGNTLIIHDSITNEIYEDKILHVTFTTIGLNNYAVIKTQNPVVAGTIEVADRDKGLWLYTSFDTQNGVYEYVNGQLTPLTLMLDKYKTYSQIVYTYQGETNMNKQFYLRRDENKWSSNYGLYPVMNGSDSLIYSEGEAYLIKAEIDYSLNIDNTSTLDLISLASCCECIANINLDVPDHPVGPPPYDIDTDAFRLLFLDSNVGQKVFTTNNKGIGDYKLTPNALNAQAADVNIVFYPYDANSLPNAVQAYVDDKFLNFPGAFNYDFIYQPLNPGETYSASFNTASNTIVMTDFTGSGFTRLNVAYDGVQEIFPTSPVTLRPGDFINIKMEFTIDGESYTALDDQFMIQNNNINDGVNVELDIYPALDINFVNEFNLANTSPNGVVITIDVFHTYGISGANIDDSMNALKHSINSTIFGKLYDFIFTNDGTTVTIDFNGLRQNHKYKWYNHGMTIDCNSIIYEIEHTINKDYRPYFYGYNIEEYLTQYLGLPSLSFPQLTPVSVTYYNIAGSPNRFGVEGSNKTPGKGNIIYFGSAYKELILDNLKRNTLFKLTNLTAVTFDDNIWISDIYWNDEEEYGTIVTLNEIDIPATSNSLLLEPVNTLTDISTKVKTILDKQLNTVDNPSFATYKAYKPDTASYAFAMMNYANNGAEIDASVLNNITALVYKEYNEPRISFLKRDRKFKFANDQRINVHVATDTNITIATAPANIDGYTLNPNDIVVVKDQIDPTENGVYVFSAVGNPLTRYTGFNRTNYWIVQNGLLNTGKSYQAYYELPLVYGTTTITFLNKYYSTKKDNRLTIKPVAIAKLGVDNETQPWLKINAKYDSAEVEENVLTIQPGINSINQIRFIDGLSEYNILNDINGQGQYSWILGENVLTENAVVGCTQDDGPGTGTLIWYTGTWVEGTWCNGIWIQGTWESGIWVNGIRYAYPIQDFYYYVAYTPVTNNLLSPWLSGTWLNGTWNGGIATDILWYNGTFNDGTIIDGRWYNGTFNKGVIKHIVWDDGLFTGGDFETGIWKAGTLNELSPVNPARFGIGADSGSVQYTDRAIWLSGTFIAGEFHSGDNTSHNGSIFYSGYMDNADFYGGTFIMGVFKNGTWHDGVWFGGYNVSIADAAGNDKTLTFTPDEYDDVLGLTTTTGYIANTAHRIHTYGSSFYLLATPIVNTAFSIDAFLNVWDSVYNAPYVPKTIVTGTATDLSIDLDISANPCLTSYVVGNPNTNAVSGYPFICSEFSGTWKAGIWLNGYFKLGVWETGAFINGYVDNAVFGLN